MPAVTKARPTNATEEAAESFVHRVLDVQLTPELQKALKIPLNREMFEFELGRICSKVITSGFK